MGLSLKCAGGIIFVIILVGDGTGTGYRLLLVGDIWWVLCLGVLLNGGKYIDGLHLVNDGSGLIISWEEDIIGGIAVVVVFYLLKTRNIFGWVIGIRL